MATPYEKIKHFDAVSGEDNFIELDVPHRGCVLKFILVQLSGPLDGFNADLYSSHRAVADILGSSQSSQAEAAEPSLYKVIPSQVVAAAADRVELWGDVYPYVNQDGSISVPVRKLHLRIEPDGSGTKAFAVAIAVDSHVVY